MSSVWVIERRVRRKNAKWQFWTCPTNAIDSEPLSKKEAQSELMEFREDESKKAEFRLIRYERASPTTGGES